MKTFLSFLTISLLFGMPVFAQSFTRVSLVNPTLVSAPNGNLKPGALYKYVNAANGVDAYVQFVKTSNTGNDDVGLFAFDNLASVNNPGGYDSAFQPVTSCSGTNSSGLWTYTKKCGQGYVSMSHSANQNYLAHFRVYFKKSGTNVDTALNILAAFIDIDGFGNGTEAEQDAFMPGVSYALSPSSTLTVAQRPDKLYNAEGKPANVGGITFTQITAITQIVYKYRTFIDFAVGMNTHSASASGGCYDAVSGGRLSSVSFAQQPTGMTVVTSTSVTLSGTVWDDADGSANNTFNNIKTNSETGTNAGTAYVYVLDSTSGTIIGKATVASNGTWSVPEIPKDLPVSLLLSKINLALGVTNGGLTGTLGSGWVATSPLARPVFTPTANMSNLDFGVEKIPVVNDFALDIQPNPGGANTVSIPIAAFTGADYEDGAYATGLVGKKVTLYPANAATLYYDGLAVSAKIDIPVFNPTKVTLDPSGPDAIAIISSFKYAVFDAASEASIPKTITAPFAEVKRN